MCMKDSSKLQNDNKWFSTLECYNLWSTERPLKIKLQEKDACLGSMYLAHNILNLDLKVALEEESSHRSLSLGTMVKLGESQL